MVEKSVTFKDREAVRYHVFHNVSDIIKILWQTSVGGCSDRILMGQSKFTPLNRSIRSSHLLTKRMLFDNSAKKMPWPSGMG